MFGNSITFEGYPLEEVLRIMRGAGFTGVEMWKPQLKRCRTPQLRARFADFAAGMGLRMGGLNVVGEPYYQPFGGDKELEATLEGLKADVEYALSLGAHEVLIWEGVRPEGAADTDVMSRLLPRLVDLFRAAIAYAKPRGARFFVEPHPFTVGMSDRLLIKLCDALDPGHFGITYDFCHYGVGRQSDYISAVRALGARIRHIHFSDSDQVSSELHFAPGDGRMDIPGLLRAFKEIGYDGTITLDLYGNPTPVEAAHRSVPRLREACDYLGLPAARTGSAGTASS